MNENLNHNQATWDTVADQFFEASALPEWGPFGVGSDLDLISDIEGKTFLEIGCGSGRSIKHLVEKGAKKVYGVDISKVQLEEASRFNKDGVEAGQVELIQSSMEQQLDIEKVDAVFSVYAIGWTIDPVTTLANIYSYLKPGGLFTWSWDHTFFSDVKYEDGKYVVDHSYHEENELALKDWKTEGTSIHITYRKTSTWFQFLIKAGFEVIAYHEPAPNDLNRGFIEPEKYYSIEKAKKVPATFIFVCRKK